MSLKLESSFSSGQRRPALDQVLVQDLCKAQSSASEVLHCRLLLEEVGQREWMLIADAVTSRSLRGLVEV